MSKKICGIATMSGTVEAFMLGNLNYMAEHGYEAYCMSQNDANVDKIHFGNVKYIPHKSMTWGMVGPITFFKNVRDFYKVFKKEKFDIIQYATFNAALSASIAGWLARVPVRINLQWGMSYASRTGFQHYFRRTVDKIICLCSTSVQPDSRSNYNYAVADHLYPARKGCVIYNGSACGVNFNRFDINKRAEWRAQVFEKYGLTKYKRIFGYVGRLIVEKGINELMEAFEKLNDPESCLIFVGRTDRTETLNQELLERIKSLPNVIFTGSVKNPEVYYAAFDFMILPSYQEGFGMTVLETAAMGTPPICTNIKGPTDFVKNDVTGLVCEVKSVDSLYNTLMKACQMNEEEYQHLAQTSYNTVKRDFDSETFKQKFYENREELLNSVKK